MTGRTARARQQRRQQLGRALRHVPGRGVDARADAQRAARLHRHAAAHAAAGEGRVGAGPGPGDPHRQRGRAAGAGARDVRVQRE